MNIHNHMTHALTLSHTGLNELHLTPEYALTPQYMDLSDIFDFPDVMTTASDKDIPNLEDVLEL